MPTKISLCRRSRGGSLERTANQPCRQPCSLNGTKPTCWEKASARHQRTRTTPCNTLCTPPPCSTVQLPLTAAAGRAPEEEQQLQELLPLRIPHGAQGEGDEPAGAAGGAQAQGYPAAHAVKRAAGHRREGGGNGGRVGWRVGRRLRKQRRLLQWLGASIKYRTAAAMSSLIRGRRGSAHQLAAGLQWATQQQHSLHSAEGVAGCAGSVWGGRRSTNEKPSVGVGARQQEGTQQHRSHRGQGAWAPGACIRARPGGAPAGGDVMPPSCTGQASCRRHRAAGCYGDVARWLRDGCPS